MLNQQAVYPQNVSHGFHNGQAAHRQRVADAMFTRSLNEGRRNRLWGWLGRENNQLTHLSPDTPLTEVEACQQQRVMLSEIKGSIGGRVRDFDADFRPLNGRSRTRWVSVAAARQQGVRLPPVELIQVDDAYFVVDGHHRLSVAQAAGEDNVVANVTRYTKTTSVS